MRCNRTGLGQHLTTLDILFLDTAQQAADVVAGLSAFEQLAEHLDAGHDSRLRIAQTNDLDLVVYLDDTTLNTTGHDRATSLNREDVLNRHHKGHVKHTRRLGDVGIESVHQLGDALGSGIVGIGYLGSRQRRTTHHGEVIAGEIILGQQLTHLHLNQIEQLGVVDEVNLVEEDDDRRHTDLTRQEDMLAGLRHRAVSGTHNHNRAIHLGCAGNHVLDEVGMSGAVDVRIVAILGCILDVRRSNRQNLGRITTAGRL